MYYFEHEALAQDKYTIFGSTQSSSIHRDCETCAPPSPYVALALASHLVRRGGSLLDQLPLAFGEVDALRARHLLHQDRPAPRTEKPQARR